MFSSFLLSAGAALGLLGVALGYGTEVPVGSVSNLCEQMRPYHSEVYDASQANPNPAPYISPQTSETLYEFIVNNTCFKSGDVLKVTMRGKIPVGRSQFTAYKGVFAMARKSSAPTAGVAYGTFTIPSGETNLGTYTCFGTSNSAVGHINRNLKRDNYVLWTAPSDLTSNMVFVGTFVEERTVLWTNVRSSTIKYNKDCGSSSPAVQASLLTLAIAVLSHFAQN